MRMSIILGLTLFCLLGSVQSAATLERLLVSHPEEWQDLALTKTSGSLPGWLSGTLYRVGPGLFEHGRRSVNGLTDGLAKVHSWSFPGNGGDVSYTGKMLKSGVYNASTVFSNSIFAPYPVCGDVVPDFNIIEKARVTMGGVDYFDNTNIAVWNLDNGNTVTVTGESPKMNQIHRDSLDMIRQPVLAINERLMSMFSASHFSKHPMDGSSFNYIASLSMNPLNPFNPVTARYEFYRYTSSEGGHVKHELIGSIPMDCSFNLWPLNPKMSCDIRLIHAFGLTQNFIVVPRWNYYFDFTISIRNLQWSHMHMCDSIKFLYGKPAYVDIMDIISGDVHHFILPNEFQAVHPMNTFERTNSAGQREVVMDYPTMTDVHKHKLNEHCMFDVLKIPFINDPEYMYENLPWDTTLRRFVFNLDTGRHSISDFPQLWRPVDALVEFPYINPEYLGKEYCFAYFQQWQYREMSMDLLKYDVCKLEVLRWHEENKHVQEPVYAPNPNSVREDDGVIVAPVFDSITNGTEIYVWNATDLSVLAIYDNKVPVTMTIHGMWFED